MMKSHLALLTAFIGLASTIAPLSHAQDNQPVRNGVISPNTAATAGTPANQDPNTPGATGDAKVVGDPSTVAGDKRATIEQRTGQGQAGSGGGAN